MNKNTSFQKNNFIFNFKAFQYFGMIVFSEYNKLIWLKKTQLNKNFHFNVNSTISSLLCSFAIRPWLFLWFEEI